MPSGLCGISTLISAHSVRKINEYQAQDRPVAAHMEIFEMELRDEAGSGGEETRMRRGPTSGKLDDEKLGPLRSGFWRYCVVIGPLSRHLTYYNLQFAPPLFLTLCATLGTYQSSLPLGSLEVAPKLSPWHVLSPRPSPCMSSRDSTRRTRTRANAN